MNLLLILASLFGFLILFGFGFFIFKKKTLEETPEETPEETFKKNSKIPDTPVPGGLPPDNLPVPKDETSLLSDFEEIFKDPETYKVMGIQATRDIVIHALVKGWIPKMMTYASSKALFFLEKRSPAAFSRILLKLGPRYLEKLGYHVSKDLLEKMTKKVGTTVAIKLAELGPKMAVTAPLGPLALPIDALLLGFDIINIAIDIADPLEYGNLTYNKLYRGLKIDYDKEFKDTLTESGETSIPIIGPLDKLQTEEYKNKYSFIIQKLLAPDGDIMKTIMTKIDTDIKSGVLNPDKIDEYIDINMPDSDIISTNAMNIMCTQAGGIMLEGTCSFSNPSDCNKNYNWPLKDTDQYTEWDTLTNSCRSANPTMKIICETDKIPYNNTTGICNIDSNYCLNKGADWDDNIKDCSISTGQSIAEMIFGVTLTRSLKQVFDPAQYENCKRDETDTGYFCNKITCDISHPNLEGLLCYDNCPSNYIRTIPPLCLEECNPSTQTDTGLFCLDNNCNSTQGEGVGICYDNCNPNQHEVGALCRDKCKSGYNEVAGVCWQDSTPIGIGVIHDGHGGDTVDGSGKFLGDDCPNPSTQTDMGFFCINKIRYSCPSNKPDSIAGLCYASCPQGQSHNNGDPMHCTPPGPLSYIPSTTARNTNSMTHTKRSSSRSTSVPTFKVRPKNRKVSIGGSSSSIYDIDTNIITTSIY